MQTPVTDAQPVNWGEQVGQGQAGSHRFQVIINIIIFTLVNIIVNIIVKIVIIVIVIFNNIIIIVVGDVGANIGK